MDAFESIVAALFEAEGFWVRRSVRLELPPEKRRSLSSPRSELDIVALSPAKQELWVVECKSFLDSRGVKAAPFINRALPKYRLFLDNAYWQSVEHELLKYLNLGGSKLRVRRCLVAGKIAPSNAAALKDIFDENGWELRGPDWICRRLTELESVPYQNDAVTMAVKLLARK
jgi:hypothetical protein